MKRITFLTVLLVAVAFSGVLYSTARNPEPPGEVYHLKGGFIHVAEIGTAETGSGDTEYQDIVAEDAGIEARITITELFPGYHEWSSEHYYGYIQNDKIWAWFEREEVWYEVGPIDQEALGTGKKVKLQIDDPYDFDTVYYLKLVPAGSAAGHFKRRTDRYRRTPRTSEG